MNDQLIAYKPDDEICYRLQAAKTLVQETVRLRMEINALVSTAQRDTGALEARIRSSLNSFIKAEWLFYAVKRVGATVGYEQVSLLATARVPNEEIFDLETRARNAGTEGLSLEVQNIDYSLPGRQVTETVKQLRNDLLAELKTHIAEFSEQTGRQWRIGRISFNSNDNDEWIRRRYRKGLSADDQMRSEEEETGMTGAERITISADVILRAAS